MNSKMNFKCKMIQEAIKMYKLIYLDQMNSQNLILNKFVNNLIKKTTILSFFFIINLAKKQNPDYSDQT